MQNGMEAISGKVCDTGFIEMHVIVKVLSIFHGIGTIIIGHMPVLAGRRFEFPVHPGHAGKIRNQHGQHDISDTAVVSLLAAWGSRIE